MSIKESKQKPLHYAIWPDLWWMLSVKTIKFYVNYEKSLLPSKSEEYHWARMDLLHKRRKFADHRHTYQSPLVARLLCMNKITNHINFAHVFG